MENHNWTQPSSQTSPGQVFGNPAAPYINSLVTPGNPNAAQTSYASNYINAGAGVHPSEPGTDLLNNAVAQYNWITPNQFNDMHSALTGGFTYNGVHYTGDQADIAQGDNFLSQIVPMIEASNAYKNDGAIVLWWDESEGGDDPSRTLGEIVISPDAKGNAYTNNIRYTHSSDLLTMQEIFGVGPCLRDACPATDLSDLFKAGAIPEGPLPTPEPGTFGVLLIGLLALASANATSRRKRS